MPLDPLKLTEWFNRFSAPLEYYASQWTPSAADCVQEAFIQLAQQLTVPDNAEAWLYRVVRNKALNVVRSDTRRACHERTAAESIEDRLTADSMARPFDLADLDQALGRLSADLREIVSLRVWSELTWQEIGDLVGSSSSSTQRAYIRALEELRRHLEAPCQTKPN